jgi:hypothetical protein
MAGHWHQPPYGLPNRDRPPTKDPAMQRHSQPHLEPCQNPISGHVYTISVYCDIVPDIGHDILRHDIGTYPILGDTISCHTRYQVYPISGMSRYRDRHP